MMVQLQQNQCPSKTNSFGEHLKKVAGEVEVTLENLLPQPTSKLHEAMRYAVLGGGKRLRALMVYDSCEMFDIPPSLSLKIAASLEIIHSYSLVHDDLPCMDDADLRRGKPSCHKVFGEAAATLVGDALIPLAYQILSTLETAPDISLDLIRSLAEAIGSEGLVAGQMIDLRLEGEVKTYDRLLEQERHKTGALFAFAAEVGAILARSPSQERQALKSCGYLIGRAFQMIDDWLDTHGDQDHIGKPNHQDLEKLTFLSLLGKEGLSEKVQETLDEALTSLAPFGEKATPLKETGAFLLSQIQVPSS